MKKIILTLALAAELISFASSAKADSTLTYNFTPATDPSQTLFTWNFSGDILSSGFIASTAQSGFYTLNAGFGISTDTFNTLSSYIASSSSGGVTPRWLTVAGGTITDVTSGQSLTLNQVGPAEALSRPGQANPYTLTVYMINNIHSANAGGSFNISAGDNLVYTPGTDSIVLNIPFADLPELNKTNSVQSGGFKGLNTVSIVAVPEPSPYALFGLGVLGMLTVLRRKRMASGKTLTN